MSNERTFYCDLVEGFSHNGKRPITFKENDTDKQILDPCLPLWNKVDVQTMNMDCRLDFC